MAYCTHGYAPKLIADFLDWLAVDSGTKVVIIGSAKVDASVGLLFELWCRISLEGAQMISEHEPMGRGRYK